MADDISTPSSLYWKLMDRWQLPDDLMAGTLRMRWRTIEYLPMHPKETGPDYERRLLQTFLFNVFKRTVASLRGKVFGNPLILGEDTPEAIVEWSRNIDMQGRDLTSFCHDIFTDGLVYGVSYILITFPRTGPDASLDDTRMQGARPYFVHISPKDLIGWKFDYSSGYPVLTQARIKQKIQIEDGEYDTKDSERIWLLERGSVQIWQKMDYEDANSSYILTDEYTTSLDAIPLVPFYTMKTAEFESDPPLDDLAYKNLEHYQSASDQRHILHIARVPILFGAGLTPKITKVDEQTGKVVEAFELEIGPNTTIFDANESARLGYVYHDRAPIDAGRQDLKDLVEQMEALSLVPLLPQRTGNVVATAKVLEEAQANSALAAWALNLRSALEEAYRYLAAWANYPSDISVQVPTEFGLSYAEFEEVRSILTLRRIGDLSRIDTYAQLQRYNVLPDDFDAEQAIKNLEQEALETEAMESTQPMPQQQNEQGELLPSQTENLEQIEAQEDLPGLSVGVQRSTSRL